MEPVYKDIAVAYSCDDRYAPHVGISLLSLLDNNPWINRQNIYVVDGGISAENKKRISEVAHMHGATLTFVNLEKITEKLRKDLTFPRNAYARIFLPDAIEEKTLWYFDGDTVIVDDLSPLLDIDMKESLLAGVQDTVNPYFTKVVGLSAEQRYLNSGGVILFNCKLWRSENVAQQCAEYIDLWQGNPPFDDQGVLNHVCRGRTMVLPVCYNVMPPLFRFDADRIKDLFRMHRYYSVEEVEKAISKPRVVHFTAEFFNRPWFSNCTHPLKHLYLNYKERSPWRDEPLPERRLTRNCRIQNFVYDHLPFCIYKSMVRFIELRHRLRRANRNSD